MASLRTHIARLRYELLLLLAAAIWGLGTVVVKDTVAVLPPAWLVGIRFFSAGVIFAVVFAARFKRLAEEGRLADHLRAGVTLGLLVIMAYLLNTGGLTGTTAAKSSFLTGTYCVLVPFIAWAVMRVRPTLFSVAAAVMCLIGIGLVSSPAGGASSLSWGDGVTLCSAVVLGFQVVATSKLAPGRDMTALTALQFLFGGAFALAVGALCEPAPSLEVITSPEVAGNLVYLIVFATCAALYLQNLGLARVAPSLGALLLSFESVFGVMFSVWLLSETLTVFMIVGFVLIFLAVVVSEWLPTSWVVRLLRGRRSHEVCGACDEEPCYEVLCDSNVSASDSEKGAER